MNIPFSGCETEVLRLKEIIKEHSCKSILEIGSLYGYNFYHMVSTMAPGSFAVSIDWPAQSDGREGSEIELRKVIKQLEKNYNVELHLGNSHDPEMVSKIKAKGRFDLVYIDGDHSYNGAIQDFENYGVLGKIIAFHDIANQNFGVCDLWQEMKQRYPNNHESIQHNWHPKREHLGIGVIYMEQ